MMELIGRKKSMNKNTLMKKYYNSRAVCQVLACLLENPKLVKSRELPLTADDFIMPLHKLVFGVVYDLAHKDVSKIRVADIEAHLNAVSPISCKKFFDVQGVEWVEKILDNCEFANYEHYYWCVRKMTCLRSYISQGVDVSDLLDYTSVDVETIGEQEEKLFKMSMNEIISYFDKKSINAKKQFIVTDSESGQIGEDAEKSYLQLRSKPAYGFSFESEYMNTIARGLRRKALYIESRDSGTGK